MVSAAGSLARWLCRGKGTDDAIGPRSVALSLGARVSPAPRCSPNPTRPKHPGPAESQGSLDLSSPLPAAVAASLLPPQPGADEAKVPAISVFHRGLINRAGTERLQSPPIPLVPRTKSIFKPKFVSWADRGALGLRVGEIPGFIPGTGPKPPSTPIRLFSPPSSPLLWPRGPVPISCATQTPAVGPGTC